MYRLGALLIGYLLGGVQSAILVGRMHGIDIRTQGSGNAGTTNTVRVLGKKAGACVLLVDILKTVIAILLARLLFSNGASNEPTILVSLYAGIGAVLGHCYPLFFNFKGGKGIASVAGLLIGTDLRMTAICAVLFFGCFAITRIVSISSLLVTASIPILLIVFYCAEPLGVSIEVAILGFAIMGFTYYRHKENIKRILAGTESKLISKK